MIKKILILFFTAYAFANVFGQGGSAYTRNGLGDLMYSNSSRQMALGDNGNSLTSANYINLLNPASIFAIQSTRFGVGLNSNISKISDANSSALYTNVKFSGFHIAFPIEKDLGITVLLGLSPYSNVNYEVINNNSDSYASYQETYKGAGGLSKLFVSTSYVLPYGFAIGASFDYYLGNIQYSTTYDYIDTSGLYDSYFNSEFKYRGIGTSLGVISPDLSDKIGMKGFSDFRIGIAYDLSTNLITDTSLSAYTTLGEKVIENGIVDTKLPARFNVGLSLTYDETYLLDIGYTFQNWAKFEKNNRITDNLRNLKRYNIGLEIGEQEKRFATFWELIKYRVGLSYEQSQYQFKNTGINQFGVHGGISFPLGIDNSIDIGFMYGQRGTTDSNLLKENIYQASFSINFGELWFIRRDR